MSRAEVEQAGMGIASDAAGAGTPRRGLWRLAHRAARVVLVVAGVGVLVAGLLKFEDPGVFKAAIISHGLLPEVVASPASVVVPGAEVLVAMGGLASVTMPAGSRLPAQAALGMALLFGSFMGYCGVLAMEPPAEPSSCGCGFRTAPITDWAPLVAQNGVCCAVMGGVALVLRRRTA